MRNRTWPDVLEQLRTVEPSVWGAMAATMAVLVVAAKLLSGRRAMKLPPGPPNWPIVGAMFSMGSELHRVFSSLSDRYGPIMYFRLGLLPVVVVSSAEMAEELLKQKDVEFASRAHNQILFSTAKYFGFGAQGIAFASNTPLLQRLRKVSFAELLSQAKLMSANSIKLRNEELGEMVREIHRISQTGEPVCISEILHNMTINVMYRVVFGKRYYGPDSPGTGDLNPVTEFKHLMIDSTALAGKLNLSDLIPALRSLDLQGLTKEFAELSARQRHIIGGILEERKKNRKSAVEEYDFIDTLIALDGDQKLTDDQIMATISDMIVGGTDTSATTSEWALIELLRHPDVLAKLTAEVEGAVGRERAVNEGDITRMPYLAAVAKEVLRLFPPLTTTIPRMNEHAATTLGGYDIPKGSSVFVNLWAIGRDPRTWDRPEEFRPERFLEPEVLHGGSRASYQYLPFGAGRRKCLGSLMGQLLVQLIIATLVQAFDFRPPEGKAHSDISNRDVYGFVLRPRDPFTMRATLKVPLDIYAQPTSAGN